MEFPSHYDPQSVEGKWYAHWLEQDFFHATPDPDKEPYTVIMPPPNVTGILHMGHVLNNTIQDVLVRRARMQGKVACWVPGTDHASIATEAKVVAMLREQGINKHDLTRTQFLEHAWAWKEKYGGTMLAQLKKLGVSCDWERLAFTMDQGPSEAVQKIFVRLYEQGHIYQGKRMVHWDPEGKTALSDDEVIYREVQGNLYYIRYAVVGSDEAVTIATTRPETLLGDTAICIHPEDERFQHLRGQQVIVPLVNRAVPVIEDAYVDPTFGTGCLKVTPAHDLNDYALGERHGLEIIDILNEDGTLSVAAQHYVGEDRSVARKKIVEELRQSGHLVKVVPHTHNVGYSERTNAVVEPRLSTQWFVAIQDIAAPALAHVMDGTIQFHPSKFKNMYKSWMENVRDWCISRQLWWGHRIPAYYLPDGTVVVAESKEKALQKAQAINAVWQERDLRQDEDVLDTWFSAWLWPISVFDGIRDPENADVRYFYPTNDLVTAPEIIFFWVARMVMAGYAFQEAPPFRNVYFTGIVRDKQGRKMSKSLGNSPDPIALMDQYSTDGVRVGMLLSAPAGNDLLFDEKLCEQGRNFANKLWNAFRLVQHWETTSEASRPRTMAVQWFQARLDQAIQQVDDHFQQFRIADALMVLYKLVWNDFCAWYLEMIKPAAGEPLHVDLYQATTQFFGELLKLLHPFMPFLTEELWHRLQDRSAQDCLVVAPWPVASGHEEALLEQGAVAFELITALRSLRVEARVSTRSLQTLYVVGAMPSWLTRFSEDLQKMAYLDGIEVLEGHPEDAHSCTIGGVTFCLLLGEDIDVTATCARLEKELAYARGFLEKTMQKLGNARFVQSAPPAVVALEQKKREDAEANIQALQERIRQFSK